MQPDLLDRAAIRRRLDRAWERFVRHGELEGVRPEIARSWTRARDVYRIDPGLRRAPLLPGDELARRFKTDETFAAARPILDVFAARVGEAGHALAFFDADGWMLAIGGDGDAVARLATFNYCPGAGWREDATGTNGAGTSLADRSPTEVFASEHFVEAWHGWTTAAAPVLAPGGAPLALVAVTGPWDSQERPCLLSACAIAAALQERIRARDGVRDELVRYALAAARAGGDALVAVDARGQVLQSNDAAARAGMLEGGALPPAARVRVAALLGGGEPVEDELALEWASGSGDRRRVVCSVVHHEDRPIGAVLRLLAAAPRPSRAGGVPRAPAPGARDAFRAILGGSERLRAAVDLAQVAARNDLPVVLYGESGTGKELFARGIHAASARAEGRLVALNCGAIPASLVESELFGYEPGTFTGAQREGRAGKLEEADGGTLFLDEVSELPPQAQTALLRVLQENEVVRLGGSRPRPVDVRIICATNRRLDDEVAAGRFRHDLFFRLNVLTVMIPPLRERLDDVPLLSRAFLGEAEERTGRSGLSLSDAALGVLSDHGWPGNVRELKNVIMRAAAVVATPAIGPADLLLVDLPGVAPRAKPASCGLRCAPDPSLPCQHGAGAKCDPAADRRVEPVEPDAEGPGRDELVAALDASSWNIARAANQLGVSRMTLYRRLRKFGITR